MPGILGGGYGTFGLGGVYAGEIIGSPELHVDLVVQPSSHSHTTPNIAVTQVHTFAVANANHTHTTDNLTVAEIVHLIAASSTHGVSSPELLLTSGLSLVINNTTHSHTTDNLTVTQVHGLVSQSSSHSLTSTNIVAVENKSLVTQNTTHSHTATSTTLNELYTLGMSNATHSLTSDNLVPVQHAVLAINNNTISTSSDNISPILEYALLSTPSASTFNLSSDVATIQHQYILSIQDNLIKHTIRTPQIIEWKKSDFEKGNLMPSGIAYGQIEDGDIIGSGVYTPGGIETSQYKSSSVDEEGFYRYN